MMVDRKRFWTLLRWSILVAAFVIIAFAIAMVFQLLGGESDV